MATANKPWKVFRSSGVSVSIFQNKAETKDGETRTFFKTVTSKTYRDGDEFKSTNSLSTDDLPVAMLLQHLAWNSILAAESEQRDSKE